MIKLQAAKPFEVLILWNRTCLVFKKFDQINLMFMKVLSFSFCIVRLVWWYQVEILYLHDDTDMIKLILSCLCEYMMYSICVCKIDAETTIYGCSTEQLVCKNTEFVSTWWNLKNWRTPPHKFPLENFP